MGNIVHYIVHYKRKSIWYKFLCDRSRQEEEILKTKEGRHSNEPEVTPFGLSSYNRWLLIKDAYRFVLPDYIS